jgi:hypothetical protein
MGVRELGVRKAILDTVEARSRVGEAAIKKEKEVEETTEPGPSHPQPSAPPETPVLKPSGPSMYTECVVCMDRKVSSFLRCHIKSVRFFYPVFYIISSFFYFSLRSFF